MPPSDIGELRWFWLPSNINIGVQLLTKGSDLLAYQENTTIFKHAFKYIKDTKRFTIV
jgi:hypothetical protein